MKYKIGVFGSADGDLAAILAKANELGEALAKKDVIVLTGATTGLPNEVAKAAYEKGTELWGYSLYPDATQQKEHVQNSEIYNQLFYIPKDYAFATNHQVCMKYRNVTSTAHADAGIIISGRWGTLNEFTNLFDMGKIIGVLTNTGGIADEIASLMQKIHKKSSAKVIFNDSPEILVADVMQALYDRFTS